MVQKAGVRPTMWRRKFLIYPKFQVTLLLINSSIIGLVVLMLGVQLSRFYGYLQELGVKAKLPADHLYFQFVNLQQEEMVVSMFFAAGFSILLTMIITLYLSHKLAGPITRVISYFNDISDNKRVERELTFRKKDFFQELPPAVNRALKEVNNFK
jgi:hypothetical protein